jgi:hypothetical protein
MISTMRDLIADALFASALQPSDAPVAETVRATVTSMLLRMGSDGCAANVAQEFGDHPDTAVRRMGWVRKLMSVTYPDLSRNAAGSFV